MIPMDEWTYKKAGVDRDASRKFHSIALSKIKAISRKLNKPVFGPDEGRFTNYITVGDYKLSLHTDGVGTKVLIAQLANSYWEVGWDAVAMNVNDLAAGGAEPIGIVDYIAMEKSNEKILEGLLSGIESACVESRTLLIGGETAIMPDVIKGVEPGKGFDISATALGIVKWSVRKGVPGDILIGFRSSGIHSNGLSLARKVLLSRFKVSDSAPYDSNVTIGEELLRPTRIYVNACLELWKRGLVKNFAHITGGAFLKIKRVIIEKAGLKINTVEPPAIFKLIKEMGNVSWEEMYKTFNMGIGLVAVTERDLVDDALRLIRKLGYEADIVGEVVDERGGIIINIPNHGSVRIQ